MKTMLAWLLLVLGTLGGLYFGGWVCFIGGIVDVIEQIKAPVLSSGDLAWGVLKVVSASLVGWCVFGLGSLGAAILND